MQLHIAIQAHPKRYWMATELAAGVDGRIVWDPEPDGFPCAWRTFRACLESVPHGDTHLCILQDDVKPVWRFRKIVEKAVSARPHRLIALFVSGAPRHHMTAMHEAGWRGDEWALLENAYWFPVVGSVWPVALIPRFLEYVDAHTEWPPKFCADDERVGRWMRDEGLTGLATVPSLVEHEDMVDSLTGVRAWGGQDPNRVSTCPPPADCDLLSCDWQQGPE